MRFYLLTTSALALVTPLSAYADSGQTAQTPTDNGVDTIVVTGTRQSGMRASDSPAPIQVVGAAAIQNVGPVDLGGALARSLPSLNVQGFGNDTANLTLSVALRGISPNDTLVLVNGKRRHTTANLAVAGGSPFSGGATTDLSFVPVASIQRIEGAAGRCRGAIWVGRHRRCRQHHHQARTRRRHRGAERRRQLREWRQDRDRRGQRRVRAGRAWLSEPDRRVSLP
ncbi:TonB-dependent receptor plug domain-containing protein [Sphingomonas adhaesiva]|uniref:TonB-dependent receptor plug domain-containing protein n=1 Tax=Sphingomonas adhaesiva TaxID=28212 RepID=UPI002FF6CF4F